MPRTKATPSVSLPSHVLRDRHISRFCQTVYLVLEAHPNWRQRQVADLLGTSPKAVHRAVHTLAHRGWLLIQKHGRRNHYLLTRERGALPEGRGYVSGHQTAMWAVINDPGWTTSQAVRVLHLPTRYKRKAEAIRYLRAEAAKGEPISDEIWELVRQVEDRMGV